MVALATAAVVVVAVRGRSHRCRPAPSGWIWSGERSDLGSGSRKLGLQSALSLQCRKALLAGKIMLLEGFSLLQTERSRQVAFHNLLTSYAGTLHQLTVSVLSGVWPFFRDNFCNSSVTRRMARIFRVRTFSAERPTRGQVSRGFMPSTSVSSRMTRS